MKKILLLFWFSMIVINTVDASQSVSTGLIPKKLYAITTLENGILRCNLTDKVPRCLNLNEVMLLATEEAQRSLSELRKKYNVEEINTLDPKWFYYNHGPSLILMNQ
ncbi:MAG: hypothetical protein P4L31_08810 [Candidatus Babeliales bacterium]|nr:hypothetical protein [Candidatus Babeliales bacterium]